METRIEGHRRPLFVFGGALMSAFAPQRLPDEFQLVALMAGIACVAYGVWPYVVYSCDWLLSKRRGSLLLALVGFLLMAVGGFAVWRAFFPTPAALAGKEANTETKGEADIEFLKERWAEFVSKVNGDKIFPATVTQTPPPVPPTLNTGDDLKKPQPTDHPAKQVFPLVRVADVKYSAFKNHAGTDDNPDDDGQVIALSRMTLTNPSPTDRISLEIHLEIVAPDGHKERLDTLGVGNFGRVLGVNDRITLVKRNAGMADPWPLIKSPVDIAAQSTVAGSMEFLRNPYDKDDRLRFTKLMTANPPMSLIFHDLVSGREVRVSIE